MTTRVPLGGHALAEDPAPYVAAEAPPFPEATLTALWLLGRVPPRVLREALPAPLLRVGRAGRGPGPDIREAAFLAPSGTAVAGDVEVHLRASDFVRHGHADDPAYAGVVLHLCWVDDRSEPGTPTPLPGGGSAPTVALASWLSAREVERLVTLGPDLEVVAPPCAAHGGGPDRATGVRELVRNEGRRRLAERTWRAWRLADRYGFDGALGMLLERAVASSAGRVRESEERRGALVAGILASLGADPVEALARQATVGRATDGRATDGRATDGRAALVEAMRGRGLGAARAGEVAWNAALPLVAALAAAYDDVALARATAALAEGWPAPRPYGRTRALAEALDGASAGDAMGEGKREAKREVMSEVTPAKRGGALYAQGLLHLQDLWCSRGGCGVCPLSRSESGASASAV